MDTTNKQNNKISKNEKWKNSRFGEIVRFIICGVFCTLIDFVVGYILRLCFTNNWNALNNSGEFINPGLHYGATAICVGTGFLVSVIVNYFLSKNWVFKNVDKNKNYGTFKYFLIYTLLALFGFGLGIGLMIFGEWICKAAWGLTYPSDPFASGIWGDLLGKGGLEFWAYAAVFCIKTLIVLIYNYFTRKFIIFKEPKDNVDSNEDPIILEVRPEPIKETPVEESVKEEPRIIDETPVEEKPVVKQVKPAASVDSVYCKPQFNWGTPATKQFVKKEIYKSLEVYDKRKANQVNAGKAKKIIVNEINEADKELKDKYKK